MRDIDPDLTPKSDTATIAFLTVIGVASLWVIGTITIEIFGLEGSSVMVVCAVAVCLSAVLVCSQIPGIRGGRKHK